jgi:Raf kinase inhibitor-like YbhB/YbcL family protein
MSMTLTSSTFIHDGPMPIRYTCDGADISPPLLWSDVPTATKSLVLIVEDPDAPDPAAPQRVWVHWLLYNLPPDCTGLTESLTRLPKGTLEGLNDWKRPGYGGPCPPIGRHRYFHRLYALDTVLPDLQLPDKSALKSAMQEHILMQSELIGSYQRPSSPSA